MRSSTGSRRGLIVLGDAIARFNPVYRQGMSVAGLEALQLHRTFATTDHRALALRFFNRIEPVVENAWSLAVGADFQFPQTTGLKPVGTDLLNRYVSRLLRRHTTMVS